MDKGERLDFHESQATLILPGHHRLEMMLAAIVTRSLHFFHQITHPIRLISLVHPIWARPNPAGPRMCKGRARELWTSMKTDKWKIAEAKAGTSKTFSQRGHGEKKSQLSP